MLGDRKEKIPFGQRKSRGAFGKRPASTIKKENRFGIKVKEASRLKEIPKIKEKKQRILKPIIQVKKKSSTLKKISKKKIALLGTAGYKLDIQYNDWLHQEEQGYRYKCYACGSMQTDDISFGAESIEWHHIKKNSSDKKNHKLQIPLCGNKCHRLGTILSAHGTPRKFREKFPIEMQIKYATEIYKSFLDYRLNAFYLEAV